MSKVIENLYGISYQEGSRGSFIGDMLAYLLTPEYRPPLTVDSPGAVGGLSRGKLRDYGIRDDINHPDNLLTYKLSDDCPDNYLIVPGFPAYMLDLNQLSMVYKNWVCIHIVYEPQDLLEIHLQNWFKNFASTATFPRTYNYYQDYLLSRRHLFKFTGNNLHNLSIDDLKKFFEIYSTNPIGIEANNKIHYSNVWKQFYETIPEQHKKKFYTLNFKDITENMDTTLAMLCEISSAKADDFIISQYQKYVNGQKKWHL